MTSLASTSFCERHICDTHTHDTHSNTKKKHCAYLARQQPENERGILNRTSSFSKTPPSALNPTRTHRQSCDAHIHPGSSGARTLDYATLHTHTQTYTLYMYVCLRVHYARMNRRDPPCAFCCISPLRKICVRFLRECLAFIVKCIINIKYETFYWHTRTQDASAVELQCSKDIGSLWPRVCVHAHTPTKALVARCVWRVVCVWMCVETALH